MDRIAPAQGLRRTSRQVRDRVMGLVRGMAHLDPKSANSVFVWPDAAAPSRWNRARYPATLEDLRPLEDIALGELAIALKTCAAEDPVADVARRFGVRRVTAGARERLGLARLPEGHIAHP